MKYTILTESFNNLTAAYAPDLPGCVAMSADKEESVRMLKESINNYLKSLAAEGKPMPVSKTESLVLDINTSESI